MIIAVADRIVLELDRVVVESGLFIVKADVAILVELRGGFGGGLTAVVQEM